MKNIIAFAIGYIKHRMSEWKIKRVGREAYLSQRGHYAGKRLLDRKDLNQYLCDMIENSKPFCVGRFGASELFCASSFEFQFKRFEEKSMKQLHLWSGFFPNDVGLGEKFNECLIDSCAEISLLGVWNLRFEGYYINQYMPADIRLTYLLDLEPWRSPGHPWTRALKGKKVLVIHPFETTIRNQYQRRELIFPGTEILPEFELKTLKAVQTIAGKVDQRFNDWFEALEWMYEKAMEMDFDVAVIGCGAYGLPLAAKIKKSGRQAIHLGGVTQIWFGIKGKRWDEGKDYTYIREYYNDYWVYPEESEKVEHSAVVEDGCYW